MTRENYTNNAAVEVKDLSKTFGDFKAVDRMNFTVKKGEIFGFLGPNGAGKSTTIKMLCGLLSPSAGAGHVSGFDILKEQESIKQNIGYMSQKFSLYPDLTVEENIDFYSGIYRIPADRLKARKEWVIKMSGLDDLRNKMTSTLSGGWKQRLALGCAIAHEPGIVFLDEPTSGVDPIARKNFWELIKEMSGKGVTVFVTTHYMDEAENCDRLALIYRGTIIAMGTPSELKSDHMKDDILAVTVRDPEEWMEKIRALKSVTDVALFGTVLHVTAGSKDQAAVEVKELFQKEERMKYSISEIEPSLEDVFVSLIESYDKRGNGSDKG
ncbi:MAG TPA: ABC transporter ATP-binding protein [Candidatus Omnitrophota bacterium]|nr:ABC transporter ATP-binding protein [Candidatus Omnitrophota bacterium]HPS20895.1 ABC transporter ATP-binding protein [Candidatus Omnitrophota bacterium]